MLESTTHYTRKLNIIDHLLDTNDNLASAIVDYGLQFYNISRSELDEFIKENEAQHRSADRTSVSQGIKHFVRDWADEGHEERQETFECILKSLAQMPRTSSRPLRVLFPGAGLGRLAHEVDKLGGEYLSNILKKGHKSLSKASRLRSHNERVVDVHEPGIPIFIQSVRSRQRSVPPVHRLVVSPRPDG